MDALLQATVEQINARIPHIPDLAIVLGSGFQSIVSHVKTEARIEFGSLPGCVGPTVPGHEGAAIVSAVVAGRPVVLVTGRMHYYEGHSMETVTLPVRALARCGVRTILLTNAAGGIREGMSVGDLMCVTDHINLMGANPLRGSLAAGGRGFVDLCGLYCSSLRSDLKRFAEGLQFRVHEGVYVAVSGPSYETPAEIRMFRAMGADAVGMSTVPEAIAARQAGLRVAALSFITNLAAGLGTTAIQHSEVTQRLEEAGGRLAKLLESFCHGARLAGQD